MNSLKKEELLTDGLRATLYIPEGEGPFSALYIEDGEELAPLVQQAITPGLAFLIVALTPADRDGAYTPWAASSPFGSTPPFAGESTAYLADLLKIKKEVEARFATKGPAGHLGLSLSGLFVLWCLQKSDAFPLAASISGSVWYPGFTDFVKNTSPAAEKADVFLSVGLGESRGRNQMLRQVGERTEELYACYAARYGQAHAALSFSEGGHTAHLEERVAAATAFLEKRFAE